MVTTSKLISMAMRRQIRLEKNKLIPDIVATKGTETKIIEVDTPGTINNDQLSTFSRSAAHRENTSFEHILTTPRKRK